jgi:hypothetical protein
VRSRPKVQLSYTPPIVRVGDRVEIQALLISRSRTPVNGITLTLTGIERAVSGHGNSRRVATHRHLHWVSNRPATMLERGEYRVVATFPLSDSAPPSYLGRSAFMYYDVEVHVDIPWWPDLRRRVMLPVRQAAEATPAPEPLVVCTSPAGPRGNQLYIEATLDTPAVAPGGTVAGRFSMQNAAKARVNGVLVELVAYELPCPPATLNGGIGRRHVLAEIDGTPAEGESIAFSGRMPFDAPCSYRGHLTRLAWYVVVTAKIAWAPNVSMNVPLVVRGIASEVHRPEVPHQRTPVGRERRAQVWKEVAARHRLTNDPHADRLTGVVGEVAVEIGLEARGRDGRYLTAALHWRPLGLRLELGKRRLVASLQHPGIDLGDHRLDKRFLARGREPAQVRAFLTPAVRERLLGFEEASLDDDGARLARKGAGQLVETLDVFVGAVLSIAGALDEAAHAVAAPAVLARHVPAWRAFAARIGARLQPGALALYDGRWLSHGVEIETLWSDDRDSLVEGTRVRFAIDPPLAHEMFPTGGRFGPIAHALAAELITGASHATFGPAAVELTLTCAALDPAGLEPVLERMARLVLALQEGGVGGGPYR